MIDEAGLYNRDPADHPGGFSGEELQEYIKIKAIAAIRNWELFASMQLTHPDEYKAARKAAFWALWPLERRGMIVDGKRYRADRRNLDVSVSEIPPKGKP